MGGLKKAPFFLRILASAPSETRILASAPSETVRSNPARPVKKFDEVRTECKNF